MRFLATILMTISLGFTLPNNLMCECKPATSEETTRWGGNHWIADRQRGTYQSINGRVVRLVDKKKMDDALVEVFDHPDYLLCEWEKFNPNKCTTEAPSEQHRIAACKTGKDGKFCFSDIATGSYELRVSRDGQWNVVHLYVVVDPNNAGSESKGITVEMTLGD